MPPGVLSVKSPSLAGGDCQAHVALLSDPHIRPSSWSVSHRDKDWQRCRSGQEGSCDENHVRPPLTKTIRLLVYAYGVNRNKTDISIDSRVARLAGSWKAMYDMELGDSMIAASGLLMRSTLLTRNVRDFKKSRILLYERFNPVMESAMGDVVFSGGNGCE
jgi:hypothetical protein